MTLILSRLSQVPGHNRTREQANQLPWGQTLPPTLATKHAPGVISRLVAASGDQIEPFELDHDQAERDELQGKGG